MLSLKLFAEQITSEKAQMCTVGNTAHGKFHTVEDLLHLGVCIAGETQGTGRKQRAYGGLAVHNIPGRNILRAVYKAD